MIRPPQYDASGINVLDPNDRLGHKSRYITVLQQLALQRYAGGSGGHLTVDLGCGFGRLTPTLAASGSYTLGIDPSEELIRFASRRDGTANYLVGALPDLPLSKRSVGLLMLHNVLRPLRQMGQLDRVVGLGEYLTDDALVVVVDNFRDGHPDFIARDELAELMSRERLVEMEFVPIRAGRNPLLFPIRRGLVPPRWFDPIARAELAVMRGRRSIPRRQYWNSLVLFRFANRVEPPSADRDRQSRGG